MTSMKCGCLVLLKMVAFRSILIPLIFVLCLAGITFSGSGFVTSISKPNIVDLGDLNFVASWDPIVNYTGMYNLTRAFPVRKGLCYTNGTSCFLGGSLLEEQSCPLIQFMSFVLEANGIESKERWISNYDFRVGPPNVAATDIHPTNITIMVQGAQTPLYYQPDLGYNCRYRGESWEGDKTPIYMGQKQSKRGVTCDFNLTDGYRSKASYEVHKNYVDELNESNGKLLIPLHKLKPFFNYSIKVWCNINGHDGRSTVYNFTTKEDAPSSGPTIVKQSSEGLGCDKPDLRNITFTIQPPPIDERNGILLYYVIFYCVVGDDGNCSTEVHSLSSPPPDSMEVTLEGISRWDAVKVKVMVNNSAGGMSSSTHQFNVLESKQAQSRPLKLTREEIDPGVWLLFWVPPWPLDSGDCILYYAVSTGDKLLGITNMTSYTLDTKTVGPVYSVKITPMIYNGSGPAFKGSEIITELMPQRSPSMSVPLIIFLSTLLIVFIVLMVIFAYMCVYHGPRWTQSFDIRNNSVLKSALAMGDIRPKAAEREEFDIVVGLPPPPPALHDDDDDDGDNEIETTALIETPPAGRAGGDAVPRPPLPDQSPPHSTKSSLSEEDDFMVAMATDVDDASFPSSSSLSDENLGVQPHGENLFTSCGECEENASATIHPFIPGYPSPTDSGYVQSPPPHLEPTSGVDKPIDDNGYFRFNAFVNVPSTVPTDPRLHHHDSDADGRSSTLNAAVMPFRYTDSGYVAGTLTPLSSASEYPKHASSNHSLKNAMKKQSSIDSETSGSISPSDSEMGEGVGCYTKLSSQPNTPLSPRSNATPRDEARADWDVEKNLNSIQSLLNQLQDQVQSPGLSNVA